MLYFWMWLIALIDAGSEFAALKDYQAQKAEGKDPVFTKDSLPEVKTVECWQE